MPHLIPFLLGLENPALRIPKATRESKSPFRSWRRYVGSSNKGCALSILVGMIPGEYGWRSGSGGVIASLGKKTGSMAVDFTLLDFHTVFLNIRVADIFEQRPEFVAELCLRRIGLKV